MAGWIPFAQNSDLPSQIVGSAILAAAFGVAVSSAEIVFRDATLEILWSLKEKSVVTLGSQIVWLGGTREDTLIVAGARQHQAGFVIDDDHVLLVGPDGSRKALSNNFRIRVGAVEVVVKFAD